MKYVLKIVALSAAVLVTTPMAATAGSTIGGQPANGGGITFGMPCFSISCVLGGPGVAEAIASGDPAAIDAALLNAISLNFPRGIGDVDLDPLPGQSGAQTVALLVELILDFARTVGLSEDSASIQALLRIAQTALV